MEEVHEEGEKGAQSEVGGAGDHGGWPCSGEEEALGADVERPAYVVGQPEEVEVEGGGRVWEEEWVGCGVVERGVGGG